MTADEIRALLADLGGLAWQVDRDEVRMLSAALERLAALEEGTVDGGEREVLLRVVERARVALALPSRGAMGEQ